MDGKDRNLDRRIENNWQGKWMIGKELIPVNRIYMDFLGLEKKTQLAG